MGPDMKESGKMATSINVRKVIFIEWFLLILTLFNAFIGKLFKQWWAKLIEEGIFAEGVLI